MDGTANITIPGWVWYFICGGGGFLVKALWDVVLALLLRRAGVSPGDVGENVPSSPGYNCQLCKKDLEDKQTTRDKALGDRVTRVEGKLDGGLAGAHKRIDDLFKKG